LLSYLANRKPGDPPDWPLSILRYLVGQIPESELLASAKNPDPKTESEHLCEAYFYSGSRHLISGDNKMAIDFFKLCIATDRRDFCEYKSAAAELKALDSPKR
jgi:lipoprotein NlpI